MLIQSLSAFLLAALLGRAAPADPGGQARDTSNEHRDDFLVRPLGSLIDSNGSGARIISQDGAYSINLNDGRALWIFGDTFYGTRPKGEKCKIEGAVFNNSALTSTDASKGVPPFTHLIDQTGKAAPVILVDPQRENPKTIRLWPGSGVKIGKRIYLYYGMLTITESGAWDTTNGGQGIAVSENPSRPFQRLMRNGQYIFWDGRQIPWGSALLKDRDGWIYFYGRQTISELIYQYKLARVRPEDIENPDQYEYYSGGAAGTDWTRNVAHAAILFDDAPPEGSVSYNQFLGKYLALYSRWLDEDVALRTAPHPWGPWSQAEQVFDCKAHHVEGSYAAKEHPEFSRDGGRIVVFTVVDGKREFGGVPFMFELDLSSHPVP